MVLSKGLDTARLDPATDEEQDQLDDCIGHTMDRHQQSRTLETDAGKEQHKIVSVYYPLFSR